MTKRSYLKKHELISFGTDITQNAGLRRMIHDDKFSFGALVHF